MRLCRVLILCWVALGMAFSSCLAFAQVSHQLAESVDISNLHARLSLGRQLLLLEDPQGSLTIEQLQRGSVQPWRPISGTT